MNKDEAARVLRVMELPGYVDLLKKLDDEISNSRDYVVSLMNSNPEKLTTIEAFRHSARVYVNNNLKEWFASMESLARKS